MLNRIKLNKILFKPKVHNRFIHNSYELLKPAKNEYSGQNFAEIKAQIRNVPLETLAKKQIFNLASLPIVYRHIAVMPDAHFGKGATIGTVLPTTNAIIPAAVGVDIGCGMIATRTSLVANDLPDSLKILRKNVEAKIPHGRYYGGNSQKDYGSWRKQIPTSIVEIQNSNLKQGFNKILSKHPILANSNSLNHLGTLGTGNHFLELCIDSKEHIQLMLHSGSRGIGNRIGMYFIELAKKDMLKLDINLPDKELSYLREGTKYFDDYVEAVEWAQLYASLNRKIMMNYYISELKNIFKSSNFKFKTDLEVVDCHHNYISKEYHFGKKCQITRKGALCASKGKLGIIPGSMGERTFIVRGKGCEDSFNSCSHGAGRIMSRNAAKKIFSIKQHIEATKDVECRKDLHVIDETPMAYKNLDDVMAAQKDLVEVIHTLKQIMCIKG